MVRVPVWRAAAEDGIHAFAAAASSVQQESD
jgi:hypothetical protein